MAHDQKVVASINAPGGHICVDIFQRADGSFGFEEYRRDAEDPGGWFAIGWHGARRFDTASQAKIAAKAAVTWLSKPLDDNGW